MVAPLGVRCGWPEAPPARRRSAAIYYATTGTNLRGLTRPAHGVRLRLRAVRSRVETPGTTVHSTYAYGDTGDNRRANTPVTATSAWAHWSGWSEVIRDSPRYRGPGPGSCRGAARSGERARGRPPPPPAPGDGTRSYTDAITAINDSVRAVNNAAWSAATVLESFYIDPTPKGEWSTIFHVYKAPPLHLFGN